MTTYPSPYTPADPPLPETADELRARIPGWGADLNPRDRPAVPRLQAHPGLPDAPGAPPEWQPEKWPRERSIEHAVLTPVFGTACPPKGLSGKLRRLAYARYSEARAAHWLMLLAADRVDTVESTVGSFFSARPDNLISETGVRGETTHGGWSSRVQRKRADVVHQPLDPLIVAGPWLLGGAVVAVVVRRAWGRRPRT